MDTEDVATLIAYNQWANHRLLAAACDLPPQDFTRDLGASWGSARGTLVHIIAGELKWLRFWLGKPFAALPVPEDFADAPALAAAFPGLEREQREFITSLTGEQLGTRLRVGETEYTLAQLIQHAVNHSTYHRGQVAMLLRQLGRTPPATDFRRFLAETRGVPSGAA